MALTSFQRHCHLTNRKKKLTLKRLKSERTTSATLKVLRNSGSHCVDFLILIATYWDSTRITKAAFIPVSYTHLDEYDGGTGALVFTYKFNPHINLGIGFGGDFVSSYAEDGVKSLKIRDDGNVYHYNSCLLYTSMR